MGNTNNKKAKGQAPKDPGRDPKYRARVAAAAAAKAAQSHHDRSRPHAADQWRAKKKGGLLQLGLKKAQQERDRKAWVARRTAATSTKTEGGRKRRTRRKRRRTRTHKRCRHRRSHKRHRRQKRRHKRRTRR